MFEWHPVYLSAVVASAALLLVFVAGTLAARFMTRHSFAGQDLVDGLLLLPLVLPPVVTGFVLLVLVGNNGAVGRVLNERFGAQIVFTPYAAILASAVVAFPLMYQSARAAMQSLDAHVEDAARSLGSSEWRVFFTVTLPLCWPGLVAGAVLSFARALGEFGATIMVAGNIPGLTTTVPLAIYFATESGDLKTAALYSGVIGVLTLGMVAGLNSWMRHLLRKRK
ncbi:MAG TPA: molybdate ABC transporter permease subunit [Abditibacteriaceae bacterium]